MLWPKIDAEYQQELQGIVEGLRGQNGVQSWMWTTSWRSMLFEELPDYYVPWLNKQQRAAKRAEPEEPREIAALSWPREAGRKTGRS